MPFQVKFVIFRESYLSLLRLKGLKLHQLIFCVITIIYGGLCRSDLTSDRMFGLNAKNKRLIIRVFRFALGDGSNLKKYYGVLLVL